jgi:hypothetical protein
MPSATFTPLLSEGRLGQLDLGLNGCAPCRITGFAGRDVFLKVEERLFADGRVLPGYLLLDDRGTLQAVRGTAEQTGPGGAVLHLSDGVAGQRRLFSRAPLVLPAHVRDLDSERRWDTFTRDVSAGGVRIARDPESDDRSRRSAITLSVGDARFVAEAVTTHVGSDGIGMRFVLIEPEHRALLAELALAYHAA